MAKRNLYDGRCSCCDAWIHAGEGVREAAPDGGGWVILCVECAAPGLLDAPPAIEASRLPSIHLDELPGTR